MYAVDLDFDRCTNFTNILYIYIYICPVVLLPRFSTQSTAKAVKCSKRAFYPRCRDDFHSPNAPFRDTSHKKREGSGKSYDLRRWY